MLDLLFTRQQEDITNITYHAPLGMSDHAVINMKYCIEEESNVSKYKGKYNYKKGDYTGLKEYLSKVEWEGELNITDINMQNEKFRKVLNEGIDKFIPKTKQKKLPSNHKNGSTQSALKQEKTRNSSGKGIKDTLVEPP